MQKTETAANNTEMAEVIDSFGLDYEQSDWPVDTNWNKSVV